MQPIESEGKSVTEAVEAALKSAGLRRDQVEVQVLQEASNGFMGMGSKPAKVRLTEKRWGTEAPAQNAPPPPKKAERREPRAPRVEKVPPRPYVPPPTPVPPKPKPAAPVAAAPAPRREESRRDQPRRDERPRRERSSEPMKPLTAEESKAACEKATVLVAELLKAMTIAAPTVSAAWDADLERVKVSVESQDANLLVGRDGRVLESLQFLVTLMMSRGQDVPIAVQVDALSYWEKKEGAVLDAARNAAESVKATGKPYRLEPMDASMRRLIHRTLAASPDVTTGSEGEGPWRKIVIRPKQG